MSEAAAPAPISLAPNSTLGKIRPTGSAILLYIVTFGIYGLYYTYKSFDELKRNTGEGLGGPLGLIIALLVGIVTPFVLAAEVGKAHARRGAAAPVSGKTGLWILLPLVGPIVWFVKVNGALNAYWRSQGVSA
jgi:hypothetical protein